MLKTFLLLYLISLATCQISVTGPKEQNYKKFLKEKIQKLPLTTMLTSPLAVGQTIHVVGNLTDKPNRVDFTFLQGSQQQFNISIRFGLGLLKGSKIVYTTWENGNWSAKDQRVSNPLKGGQEFDLRVRLQAGKLQIFANRVEVGIFTHTIPFAESNIVKISGDASQLLLFSYGGQVFANPYTAIGEVVPGKRLDVSGFPSGKVKQFNINLFRANKEYALQVSVRYGEKAIVRNAMTGNAWGKEEREGKMPLDKKAVFDITIVNEKFSWQIFVNNERFATFGHRGSPSDVKTLEIEGDVDVHSVTINDAVGV